MAIRIKKDGSVQSGLVDDNVVQPFRLEKSNVRGRMVRMGDVLKQIMEQHDYPAPVSGLLSEVVTVCLLLSGMMKYEGVFTLQIKGDGPIRMLVADVTSKGEVRAYAGFDEAAVKKAAKRKQDPVNHHYHLIGKKGYMAFTVDQGGSANDRYQGIVELKGTSITEAVQHYFTQSEQIKTSFKIAVHPQDSQWRTGAIMIQQLPDEEASKGVENPLEDWTRAAMLLATCSDGEMLSPVLATSDVLYRLFHEDGVRIYSPTHVRFKCRCSAEKVENILRTIPRGELEEECEKNGKVSIKCEFCSEEYVYKENQLDEVYGERE